MRINAFKNRHFLIALAFAIGLLMPAMMQVLGDSSLLSADAVSLDNKYDDSQYLCVEQIMEQYHLNVNNLTNEYLDFLISGGQENGKDIDVSFVEASSCDGTNVSTFCLASVLNEELIQLEKALTDRADEIAVTCDDEGNPQEESALTLDEVFASSSARQSFIQNEMEAAEDALDMTLSVYNQVQLVWPLHQEMSVSIMELENFRDHLASVRKVTEKFPSRFNDATTLSCQ
jgi:hypothetical protein